MGREQGLVLVHEAADVPSNSIKSLASAQKARGNPTLNDIREYGSPLFLSRVNPCNIFTHPRNDRGIPSLRPSGVMDWRGLI